MYNRQHFLSDGASRHEPSAMGGFMRRFTARIVLSSACVTIAGLCLTASAQTKKASVWDKIKQAAQQGQQQGQQQPQQPGQQPQQQPGQKPPKPGQQHPASAGNDSGPIHPPAGTKITETMLAPLQQGATFEVSPHGLHVATVETEGSRAVVWYDGVEGPKFDQILVQGSGHVVFSPDGNRYAYCARAGTQYVVMVDGKELVRSSESNDGRFEEATCKLGFTSNNKHVFYSSYVNFGSSRDKNFRRFVWDGKPSPNGNVDGVAFSPDGDHFAYVLTIGDPYHGDRQALMIDGKQAPYLAGTPQWTADSKHLFTQASVRLGPQLGMGYDLLFDGKPIMRAFHMEVFIPPVGELVLCSVNAPAGPGKSVSFLTVLNKKIPGSEVDGLAGSIDKVVFSPNGKHFAAVFRYQNNHFLMLDGKKQLEYQTIDKVAFTPDSSKVVYVANANGKTFLVIGDQESEAQMTGPDYILSSTGNRVAALVRDNNTVALFLDGKTIRTNLRGMSEFSFTPDAAHYGYVAIDSGLGQKLAIDGTPLPASSFGGTPTPIATKYVFSPDSKHMAHLAMPPTVTGDYERGLFLDGKYMSIGQSTTAGRLTFTPDSRHLLWFQQVPSAYAYRAYIDGKAVVQAEFAGNRGVNDSNPVPWFEVQEDGTLLTLAQDDNSLKRISITPSPETSVATMMGSGTAVASSHN